MSYPQNNLKKKIKLQKNFSQSANIKPANILDQELNRETDLLHMPKIQKAKTETSSRILFIQCMVSAPPPPSPSGL